jgi:pyruvate/2-oxoglutarate dehydrogenase complex dihydrolipoamide dehydrogenase (E3) component
LKDAGPNARVAVVGGGYTGTEVAAAVRGWNIPVTLVYPEQGVLARLFPPSVAAPYEQELQRGGVTLAPHRSIRDIVRDQQGRIVALALDNDTV